MLFGWRATSELLWLIELRVMFQQYMAAMGLVEDTDEIEAGWLRNQWVRTCMRLGHDDCLFIVRQHKEGKVGTLTSTDNDKDVESHGQGDPTRRNN